jgi:hypothetical protein
MSQNSSGPPQEPVGRKESLYNSLCTDFDCVSVNFSNQCAGSSRGPAGEKHSATIDEVIARVARLNLKQSDCRKEKETLDADVGGIQLRPILDTCCAGGEMTDITLNEIQREICKMHRKIRHIERLVDAWEKKVDEDVASEPDDWME